MICKKGLLFKLSDLGVDGFMFYCISSFLANHSIQVRVGTTLSDPVNR